MLLIVGWLVSVYDSSQRLGTAVCQLHVRPTKIQLSESVEAILTIEGPAPVEVELPEPLVDSPAWHVEIGRPEVAATAEGRERWRQSFRLIPLQSGDVPLVFRPIGFRTGHEVRLRSLRWSSISIRVATDVSAPDLSAARPLRGFEPLPPAEKRWVTWFWPVAVMVALVGLCALLLYRYFRWRPKVEITAEQRALFALGSVNRTLPAAAVAAEVADVVRRFLVDQHGIDAVRLTTDEVIQAMRQARRFPDECIAAVKRLLGRCDVTKFAGREWEQAIGAELIQEGERLIRWIAQEFPTNQGTESGKIASSPGDFSAEVKGVNQG